MKYINLLIFILITINCTKAQQPSIARVSGTGITTIYTDFKQAIYAAQDDDIIYLSGTVYTFDSIGIQKRIHIIGTGHYPDSTVITGVSILNSPIYFMQGCNGASIQGIKTNDIYMDNIANSNLVISKCYIDGIISHTSIPVNNTSISISESIVKSINGSNQANFSVKNSFILGNYISLYIAPSFHNYALFGVYNSTFKNCIFLGEFSILTVVNAQFQNCIFNKTVVSEYGIAPNSFNTTASFQNNLFTNSDTIPIVGAGMESGNLNDPSFNATFLNVINSQFNYTFDYHLKSTSLGNIISGGVGIYSGANPYNPNPINPHIYFKIIPPASNAQGQLPIQFKVKAQ